MPNGISLHIGLNKVNAAHYNQLKDLVAAVNDAQYMHHLAQNVLGYSRAELLLNEAATTDQVLALLKEYAEQLHPGDILLLSYSGHGGQTQDLNSLTPGDELNDQTWCLFDRQLIDDELAMAFSQFRKGVRILVVADSCHSGTVTKDLPEGDDAQAALNAEFEATFQEMVVRNNLRTKSLSKKETFDIYVKNIELYKAVYAKTRSGVRAKSTVQAAVKLLSACQDSQVALDGLQHGLFTAYLRKLLEDKTGHQMSIAEMAQNLRSSVPYQTPNLFEYGGIIPAFDQYSPFKIHIPDAHQFIGGEYNEGTSTGSNNANTLTERLDTTPSDNLTGVAPASQVSTDLLVRRISLHVPEGRSINLQQLSLICPNKGLAGVYLNSDGAIAEYDATQYPSAWEIVHEIAEKIDQNGLSIEAEPLEAYNFPVQDGSPSKNWTLQR